MRLAPALSVALALAGCASTKPVGRLRVDPAPAADAAGLTDVEQRLVRAVSSVGAERGLFCRPFGGSVLLSCTAAAVSNLSATLEIELVRAGTGYEVSVDQAILLAGRDSPICAVEKRLADAIDAELGSPRAHTDVHSTCPPRKQ
ncbi:MAG: hypothetical protein QM767_06800 [Anaeromyxobacter sp.]